MLNSSLYRIPARTLMTVACPLLPHAAPFCLLFGKIIELVLNVF
jgi:hypothetical protein